jgi:hypothetical protein
VRGKGHIWRGATNHLVEHHAVVSSAVFLLLRGCSTGNRVANADSQGMYIPAILPVPENFLSGISTISHPVGYRRYCESCSRRFREKKARSGAGVQGVPVVTSAGRVPGMTFPSRPSRAIPQVVYPGNPEHIQALALVQGSPDPLQFPEL